jgi:DNA-binding NarL/FixJ family response regulator
MVDITLVSSAKEALSILREKKTSTPYHIVISDIKMPEMDGIELLEAIMADPELRNIPVISECVPPHSLLLSVSDSYLFMFYGSSMGGFPHFNQSNVVKN